MEFKSFNTCRHFWFFSRLVYRQYDFRKNGHITYRVDGRNFLFKYLAKKKSIQHPNKPKVLSGLFWGTLSGFTSFISHSGAPPFQVFVLPQKLQKLVFAGTATLVFAVINLAKIIPYQDLQPYTANDLRSALVLIPFAIGGTYLGAILTKKIPDALFFTLVQIALFGVSLKLIWGTKDIFFY